MSQKPTKKWGIKLYSIADSSNGYILDSTGSETHTDTTIYSNLPKTTQVVMKLITPYLDKGYHLYTDRFYTSTILSSELEIRNTIYRNTKFKQKGPT